MSSQRPAKELLQPQNSAFRSALEAVVPLTEGKVPSGEAAGELLGQMSGFLKTRTFSLFREREHKIQSKAQWEGTGVLRATLGISAHPVAAEPSQESSPGHTAAGPPRSRRATTQPGHEGHQSLGAGIHPPDGAFGGTILLRAPRRRL